MLTVWAGWYCNKNLKYQPLLPAQLLVMIISAGPVATYHIKTKHDFYEDAFKNLTIF